MKEKHIKNLKNKIGLKNLLVSKNQDIFRPKNINIKTINIEKNFDYFNEEKNFFIEKNMKNIRYLNSISNYNIFTKNNYFQKRNKKKSLFNSSDSDSIPSPISLSLMNSPSYNINNISLNKKKFKRRKISKNKRPRI